MRYDKFTTKFQQALSEAQSLAVGNDQQFIEPQHLLLALLGQDDGSTSSLLQRAGVNAAGLKAALVKALDRLPKVQGHGGEVSVGRDLGNLLNLTDKAAQQRGDEFIASEMFLLALADDKGEAGRLLKEHGLTRKALEQAVRERIALGETASLVELPAGQWHAVLSLDSGAVIFEVKHGPYMPTEPADFAPWLAEDVDSQRVLAALAAFKGLPHRVELVATVGGVSYYDDSKGTNVGATLAAVEGLGRPVAIILGGEGKAQDFAPLKPALAKHGRAVALIGRDADSIAAALAGCPLPQKQCADMTEAVRWLSEQAQSGDAVVLSPACASLDMYRNYAHRAEAFIAAVRELPAC